MGSEERIPKFELGRIYIKAGALVEALKIFNEVQTTALQTRDWPTYYKTLPQTLRLHAEQLDFEKVQQQIEDFAQVKIQYDLIETAELFYTLGICHAYAGRLTSAYENFLRCVEQASQLEDMKWLAHGHGGLAIYYSNTNQYELALAEIEQVERWLKDVDLPDLRMSLEITKGLIYRSLEQFDRALEVLQRAQEMLMQDPNWMTQIDLLYAFGTLYQRMGQLDKAEFNLRTAKAMINPKQAQHAALQIDNRLSEIAKAQNSEFDLVIQRFPNLQVQEKTKGLIDFGKQLVLFDLLHLFLCHPGRVFSKEEIVREIWNEVYDPKIHDNKLFVTMRRLRKLIEVDGRKPRYVLRARGGYFFNSEVRVLDTQQEGKGS